MQEYHSRPDGMTVKAWCFLGIKPSTFYDQLRKVQEIFVDELQDKKKYCTANKALKMIHAIYREDKKLSELSPAERYEHR